MDFKERMKKVFRPAMCVCWFVGGLFRNVKQSVLEGIGHIRVYDRPFWFVLNPSGYKVKAMQIRKALSVIKPGDVVVRKYDTFLLSLFIPGRFSHSGVYCGTEMKDGIEVGYVTHALGSGVQKQDIIDFFMTCDEFAILRVRKESAERLMSTVDERGERVLQDGEGVEEKACRIARSYIGAKYDYKFDICEDYKNKNEVQKRTKSVYCHELTRSCYPDLDIPAIAPQLWNGMIRSGKKQFLAQSFFESEDMEVVYDSFYSEIQ